MAKIALKDIAKVMADIVNPLADRVKKLEKDNKDLMARMETRRYKGVWQDGREYECENSVTHGGSVWIAKEMTTSKPGTDDTWQLAVKRGRDGKDRGGA